jgi:hypothetical protein
MSKVQLTVILKKAENLVSDAKSGDKLEPVVTFQLPGCPTVTSAKVKATFENLFFLKKKVTQIPAFLGLLEIFLTNLKVNLEVPLFYIFQRL